VRAKGGCSVGMQFLLLCLPAWYAVECERVLCAWLLVAGISEDYCGRVMSSSSDFQMDLQRAIEMSRLQFLAETSRALALGLPEG